MIYVVGTGRCGTYSMAKELKGLHEPGPNIFDEHKASYLNRKFDVDYLMYKLEQRAKYDTPAISDYRQSLFISNICRVDPTAEFIWLIRKKDECIESLNKHKAGYITDAEHYYNDINYTIKIALESTGPKYKIVYTDELKEKISVQTADRPLRRDFRDETSK